MDIWASKREIFLDKQHVPIYTPLYRVKSSPQSEDFFALPQAWVRLKSGAIIFASSI